MNKLPTLQEVVNIIKHLPLAKQKKAPQGRKPVFSDNFILALGVYQKLAGFRHLTGIPFGHSQQMLAVLTSLGVDVPVPSTFSERKTLLLAQFILAVKQLCSKVQATSQHLDSKKLGMVDFARAKRTKLAGAYGHDHIHSITEGNPCGTIFYGFRLHTCVDDAGNLCKLLLRPAKEHDIRVAPRLLDTLSYTVVAGDKGYISRELKTELATRAVDLATPCRSNQLPAAERMKAFYQSHEIIETVFSSLDRLDRLGLSDRPYRSNAGLILHAYTTVLAYQLVHATALIFVIRSFPNWGKALVQEMLKAIENNLPGNKIWVWKIMRNLDDVHKCLSGYKLYGYYVKSYRHKKIALRMLPWLREGSEATSFFPGERDLVGLAQQYVYASFEYCRRSFAGKILMRLKALAFQKGLWRATAPEGKEAA